MSVTMIERPCEYCYKCAHYGVDCTDPIEEDDFDEASGEPDCFDEDVKGMTDSECLEVPEPVGQQAGKDGRQEGGA